MLGIKSATLSMTVPENYLSPSCLFIPAMAQNQDTVSKRIALKHCFLLIDKLSPMNTIDCVLGLLSLLQIILG